MLRSTAEVIPFDDFKDIVDVAVRIEEGFYVMVSVLTFPQDVEAYVDFDVWVCYHIFRDFCPIGISLPIPLSWKGLDLQ